MSILLVSIAEPLVGALSSALASRGETRLFAGDLRDPRTVSSQTDGVEAIVCGLPAVDAADPSAALVQASAGLYNLAVRSAGVPRLVLLSSLRPFERYPVGWRVSEYWAPRPTTEIADLVTVTAEAVVRESSRTLPLRAICLRLGEVVDDVAGGDPRALHVTDAVRAIERALDFEPDAGEPRCGWWVFHIVGAGRTRFPLALASESAPFPNGGRGSGLGYEPRCDVTGGRVAEPLASAAAPLRVAKPGPETGRRVAIFGAGGPFGAAAAAALERDHRLILADARPWDEVVATARPQQRGAPTPTRCEAPHETRVVDVTRYEQVLATVRDAEAILNLAVVRDDPVAAFDVNVVGTYNIVRAAAECGIRRVVLTGPNEVFDPMQGGYWPDFDLGSDVPQRPGTHLYMLSKFLGNEIARTFAIERELEVPVLVYGYFTNPADYAPDRFGGHPFTVSWRDTGESMRAALCVDALPRPYEVFHILGDMPHGKYRNDRAKEALRWQPRDRLDHLWQDG